MMLSFFGSRTFIQGYDISNAIYLLINRKMVESNYISIADIESAISDIYEGEYNLIFD